MPLFSFPTSHPGQYHPGALTALGLIPSHQHQSQGQPRHPVHIPSTAWPIHRPVLTTSSTTTPSPPGLKFALRSASGNGTPTGSGTSPSPMNLNDPSIIFAQPAGRQLGIGPGCEAHWHNHLGQPGSLMGNGTVVKSGIHWVNSGGGHFKDQLTTFFFKCSLRFCCWNSRPRFWLMFICNIQSLKSTKWLKVQCYILRKPLKCWQLVVQR